MLKIKKLSLLFAIVFSAFSAFAQNSVTLTFTGRSQNNDYLPLERVKINNLTRGWMEEILFPDTIFTLTVGSGIDDHLRNPGEMQVMPNPFNGKTTVNFHSDKSESVKLLITDVSGKHCVEYRGNFMAGDNFFSITLAIPQTYILSMQTASGVTHSVKMVNVGCGEGNQIRQEESKTSFATVNLKALSTNPFELGDQMRYIGYYYPDVSQGVFSSAPVIQQQYTDENIVLVFPIDVFTLPTVTTTNTSNITSNSVTVGGAVVSDGGATVTARGFCWGTSSNPTLADNYSTNGSGNGYFSNTITGLTENTTYHVRAYATNSVGAAYGNELIFTTQALTIPTVITNQISNVTENSATSGGSVTSTGGASITARGVCWSTSPNPTLADNHSDNGTGTGSFSHTISGLVQNTTYYVRAYATNSVGTAYGNERSFSTLSTDGQPCPGSPTLVDIDNNSYETVMIGSQCWMKSNLHTSRFRDGSSLVANSNLENDVFFNDSISAVIYKRSSNTAIDAWASYRIGYLYNWPAVMQHRNENNGEPMDICPAGWHLPSDSEWTVLTDYVSSVSAYRCNNNPQNIAKALASDVQPPYGYFSDPDYNYCWAPPHYESIIPCVPSNDLASNNATGFNAFPSCFWDYNGNGLPFISYSISMARWWTSTKQNETHVVVRSMHHDSTTVFTVLSEPYNYATVRCVRNEGNVPAPTLPSVRTMSVSNVSAMSAYTMGNVISNGGALVTAYGICWSTSPNPTLADNHTSSSGAIGTFTEFISSLNANTTYYVRAYATNSVGTAYGDMQMFTTMAVPDAQPCPGAATVTDCDGNIYNTVHIGNQCWMKENLRTTHYADGTVIAYTPQSIASGDVTPYLKYPNDDSTNVPATGYYYNWYAVMHGSAASNSIPSGVQGICPAGWHVPSFAESLALVDYVYSQPQYVCNGSILKAMAANTDWSTSGTAACSPTSDLSTNNATGYSAKSVGAHNSMGGWYYEDEIKQWTTTAYSNSEIRYVRFELPGYDVNMNQHSGKQYSNCAVRCIRTETSDSIATVNTLSVGGVSLSSATCGGKVNIEGASPVTNRGVCWSTSLNPTINDNHTEDGQGAGSFISTITGLDTSTVYYVRAYAVNNQGVAYGEQRVFTTSAQATDGRPCPLTPSVLDIDSNSYPTVQINNQCWLKQNLRTTHYIDASNISSKRIPDKDTSMLGQNGYMYFVDNYKYTPVSVFVPENQGVCPMGWHLPSLEEWRNMLQYVKSQPEYRCGIININLVAKALSAPFGWITDYDECNPGFYQETNNLTGFSALPTGAEGNCGAQASTGYGVTYNYGYETSFWAYPSGALGFEGVGRNTVPCNLYASDRIYLPVRCLRDQSIQADSLPLVVTDMVRNVQSGTAVSGGEVHVCGNTAVTARGVCWSTSPHPTVAGSHTSDGVGAGSFSSLITGLSSGVTYYVRAYATDGINTVYGTEITFVP